MAELQTIKDFLSTKTMAIAGVSRNPKKFGGAVFKQLTETGFTVYPINPNADTIGEVKCYPDVSSLPGEVDRLFIVTPKKQTLSIVEEANKKGIKKKEKYQNISVHQIENSFDLNILNLLESSNTKKKNEGCGSNPLLFPISSIHFLVLERPGILGFFVNYLCFLENCLYF